MVNVLSLLRVSLSSSFLARTGSRSSSKISSNMVNPMDRYNDVLPKPLILGSASYTRKIILQEMGIDYKIVVRPIDEKNFGNREEDNPTNVVLSVAQAKMDHLVQEIKAGRCDSDLPTTTITTTTTTTTNSPWNYVVLTSDQVVVCDGTILEKPKSIEEARWFVSKYGRHPPSTVGSCILTHVATGIQVSGVDRATVHFQADTPASLIDEILQAEQPGQNGADTTSPVILSCAGGLMIEHPLVQQYITHMDGAYDSVLGLSKSLVLALLEELYQKVKAAKVEN